MQVQCRGERRQAALVRSGRLHRHRAPETPCTSAPLHLKHLAPAPEALHPCTSAPAPMPILPRRSHVSPTDASSMSKARQVRRRPAARQARRGDRPAQPAAPPAAAGRDGRGGHAEEHPDDRPDRRRQDRDRPPARAARAVALPQGRSVEVHRGRLRRPRRRVDDSRSGGDRDRAGQARRRPSRFARRRAPTPRSACSIGCCRRCTACRVGPGAAGGRPRLAHPRAVPRAAPPGTARHPRWSRSTCATARSRSSRSSAGRRSRRSAST